MNTLDYIVSKYQLDIKQRSPIKLSISRHGGLTTLFSELGFKIGAEVGVEQGKFSEEICKDNPGVKLYCIDAWQSYARYKDIRSQSRLDEYHEETKARLAKYNCMIVRKTSMEAVSGFAPESLDFVYIDGNHDFEFVVNDIIYWSKTVKPGGIVAGHDYRAEEKDQRIPFHVIQAVNAYTDSYHIKPWFIIRKDRCASWMWVK